MELKREARVPGIGAESGNPPPRDTSAFGLKCLRGSRSRPLVPQQTGVAFSHGPGKALQLRPQQVGGKAPRIPSRTGASQRANDLLHIQCGGIKPSEEINDGNSQKEHGQRSTRNTPTGASLGRIHDAIQQLISQNACHPLRSSPAPLPFKILSTLWQEGANCSPIPPLLSPQLGCATPYRSTPLISRDFQTHSVKINHSFLSSARFMPVDETRSPTTKE